ncbi:hypothetical protein DSC45_06705 [Streptomyces sp. YIM 130001]|uniref:Uncharacterized protein n=1 Tax=Streptomyces triticagri TaxID=2293568 RepID=A0A372M3J4_9ACTN|nr:MULTISPECIES: hypothetical protein [Streptomyces]RFU85451.1 hypothetical protein DY218_17395 [Streptomyces triticagri]RII19685.1 hypothetical protein DSC45_06705 [Streptomyces sp. YIM 130001]
MSGIRCTQCGTTGLEPGFVEDLGQGARGYSRWIAGALERGVFGGAKRMGRPRWQIDAHRCPKCGHLEMFAVRPA